MEKLKKIFFVLTLAVLVMSLNANIDKTCWDNVKTKAKSVVKHKHRWNAKELKQTVKDVIKGLKNCGVSNKDLGEIKSFQKRMNSEVNKIVKQKKEHPPVDFYANRLKAMISNLEKLYDRKAADKEKEQLIVIKDDKTDAEKHQPEEEKDEKAPDKEEKEPQKLGKIKTQFPAEDFLKGTGSEKDQKPFVVVAEELKTRLELMEKKVSYLAGNVSLYRYGFAFLILAFLLITGLIVVLVTILRKTNNKLSHMEALVRRMRKDSSGNPGTGDYQ